MNEDNRLTFQAVGEYTNPCTGNKPQRSLEAGRFEARVGKSGSLVERIEPTSDAYVLKFRGNYPTRARNPYPTYEIKLGLVHLPTTPVMHSRSRGKFKYRSGSLQVTSPNSLSNLTAISCTCPDFSKRTTTYKYSRGRSKRENYKAGDPCVSNAFGCKHMMAANQYLGMPATPHFQFESALIDE